MTGEAETSQALVHRQPVPRELAALGVMVAQDEESGMQMVIIPDAVKTRANVLMPVQAFQQADPNWTPSLRAVALNPSKDGPHFYKQGQNLAPRKQALELLADAAGVVSTRVRLAEREARTVGGVRAETFTHYATLQIRKSDGTLRTIDGSRTYEPDAEYEEIRDAVLGSSNKWWRGKSAGTPEEQDEGEIRKRWLNEIRFAKAKNESKAVLRAIRSAIQIPHSFSDADAKKPFIVIGWNFTPPNDPETRAAIASAVSRLYGGGGEENSGPVPQIESGLGPVRENEDVDPETGEIKPLPAFSGPEIDEEPQPGQDDLPEETAAENGAEAVQEAELVEGEPEFEPEPEPEPAEDAEFSVPVDDDPQVALAEEAKAMVPPIGMFGPSGSAGPLPLEQILGFSSGTRPEHGREWLEWALKAWKGKEEPPELVVFYQALVAFVAVYAPDLLA